MSEPPPGCELLFATSNPHKLDEVRAILAPQGLRVIGLDDLGDQVAEAEEHGDTFAENAQQTRGSRGSCRSCSTTSCSRAR